MTCFILDISCHFGNLTAPVFAFWQAWDWAVCFIAGLLIGGFMGWRIVLAILTLGLGYFVYDRFKKAPEPDYETGEPEHVTPKSGGIFGDLIKRDTSKRKQRYDPDTNTWH